MKRYRRVGGLLGVLAIVAGLSACGTSSGGPPPATSTAASLASKVPAQHLLAGFVTDTGGLHDQSFNELAWLGVRDARQRMGIKDQVLPSKVDADYVRNLTRLAQSHASIVIAVGTGMARAVYQVAQEYPGERFAIVDARPQDAPAHEADLPNVANLFFKEQESGYLVGVIAGLMEKQHVGHAIHNTIGYLGGMDIPPVNRYLAGYVAGAKRVDPTIKVLGDYSQSFTDERAGRAFGLNQIDSGADILFQVAAQSGFGYLGAGQARGRYGIGVDADQGYLGSSIITSAVKRVDVAVRDIIQDVNTGRFKPYDHFYGAAQGAAGFASPSSVVPKSIVAQANHYKTLIAAGTVVPPTAIPAR